MWLFLSTNVLQWLFFEYIEKFCDWSKQEKIQVCLQHSSRTMEKRKFFQGEDYGS